MVTLSSGFSSTISSPYNGASLPLLDIQGFIRTANSGTSVSFAGR